MLQGSPGVTTPFSLAWLLQPLSVETFLAEIWGVAHYHVKRGAPDYFDGVLNASSTADELLEVFRRDPSAVRLVRGGEDQDAGSYRLADGGLDIDRVRDDYGDGYTVVLDSVEQYVRPVASLSHSIEVELDFPAKVNAYVTPPGSQGFIAHYDEHDVLILQIHGSKIWHLYSGADVSPSAMHSGVTIASAGLLSPTALRLEAGDVLYVPRGRVHAAEATSEPSVHFTVGIHAPTVLAFIIRELYSLSFTDDRVHTQLPPRHLQDPDVRANVHVLVGEIVEILKQPSVLADGLGVLEEDLVKRGRCPPVGQAIMNAVGIDGQTLVAKYQPLYARVKTVADGVALEFAQLVISASLDHEPALLFVSKRTDPFRVCELPGLNSTQQTELARTLIASGFLIRLPDD